METVASESWHILLFFVVVFFFILFVCQYVFRICELTYICTQIILLWINRDIAGSH